MTGRDFQDEQNEDGANDVAKKGPVPPASNPKPDPAQGSDFQQEQNEDGAKGQ